MEYLMTYGWAILIIAVVMVALFSLGILGGNPLGTTCLAQSGFTCQSPILHAATFNVLVGQATGTSWTSANVYWIPAGVSMATYATCPGQASNTITGGISCYNAGSSLSNGGSLTITFVFSSTVAAGSTGAGQLYALYTTSGGGYGTTYQAQLTSGVNLKSV